MSDVILPGHVDRRLIQLSKELDSATMLLFDAEEGFMAAKTAHLCLVFSPSGDGLARGIISAEPVGSTNGNRSYKFDYGSDDWWKQTPAGARYLALAAQAVGGDGMSASPLVCF